MTSHARAERLIAMAIDFPLTNVEQTELADHLATCPSCRARAAGYRSDAAAIRTLAFAEPPAFVRAGVLRAAARPARRSIEAWKLLVAAALLLTALLGAAAAIGAWNPRPALIAVVPSVAPSQIPAASAVARPAAWSTTGTMVEDRYGDTATLLPDGKVLAVGGSGGASSQPLASAELYDLTTGSWTGTGSMPTPRRSHTATLLPGGTVLVAGGVDSSNVIEGGGETNSAELYDPSSESWTPTGTMLTPRQGHTAVRLPDGKVLVVGGGGIGATVWAELFDPNSGTWAATGGVITPRRYLSATLLADGSVLVAGGNSDLGRVDTSVGPLDSAERFDPVSGSWTSTGTMVAARAFQTATVLADGKVLVAGGNAADGALDSAELYDPASGAWTVTGRMVTRRTGHTATLLPDGTVLVAGGNDDSGPLDSVELYDPISGSWSVGAKMRAPRQDHTATLLPDGTLLIAGGDHGGDAAVRAPAELYIPASGTPVVVTPSAVTTPVVLQATCDGSRPEVSTPVVGAQPDGVHISVTNTSGQPLDFSIDDGTGLAIQGDSVPGANGSYLYTFEPGAYGFTCNGSTTAFTVTDPGRSYVSPVTWCTAPGAGGSGTVGTADYGEGPRGPQGSLLEIANAELHGLKAGDVVERAGYSQAAGDASVRVVREGRVVAVIGYIDDGHGGWLIGGNQACQGSDITVKPPSG